MGKKPSATFAQARQLYAGKFIDCAHWREMLGFLDPKSRGDGKIVVEEHLLGFFGWDLQTLGMIKKLLAGVS